MLLKILPQRSAVGQPRWRLPLFQYAKG